VILPAPACESPPEDVPTFAVVAASPRDGDRDVFTTVRPFATFNVPIDPANVNGDLIRLRSGGLQPGGTVEYSVVDRSATFVPSVALRGGLAYEVIVEPSVRGIHGGTLAEPFTATFVTGVTAGEGPADPPVPGFDADAGPLLGLRCGSCHGGSSPSAAVALDDAAAADAAIAANSAQWLSWRLVKPGAPERSYLMYKIVAAPGILGVAMPPGRPLAIDERRLLERWISAGARTDD